MVDNTAKREAASKAEQGKAAAKGAANAATGQANAAAGKLASAFSDLKGDAAAMLKSLKDSLGIPTIPKIPKIPAFKQLKKFEPKKAPEPKAFQKEEKKFEFGKAAPITTKPNRKVEPNKLIADKLISSGTIRAGSMISYRGNPIYSYKNKWYYSDGTETTAYGDAGVKY